jgi:hypothetical protein
VRSLKEDEMNVRIKNILDAAGKYMDDHETDMFIRSLFTGGTTVFAIYKLRRMYRTGRSYYQKAAEKNALEQSKDQTS